jgi:hypothetical protein
MSASQLPAQDQSDAQAHNADTQQSKDERSSRAAVVGFLRDAERLERKVAGPRFSAQTLLHPNGLPGRTLPLLLVEVLDRLDGR